MKTGIMQPYVFPYVGYYQLLQATDKFVFLDDVNFINRGWINRNNILVNKAPVLFTLPLKGASQNLKINEIEADLSVWVGKFYKTLEMAYKKAPHYADVLPVIKDVLENSGTGIAEIAKSSVAKVFDYLGIKKEIINSSAEFKNEHLKAQERIIDICCQLNTATYINPIGGTELYQQEEFAKHNMELRFIKANPIVYKQFNHDFVPYLSMLDPLMFNSKEEIKHLLNQYQLVEQ